MTRPEITDLLVRRRRVETLRREHLPNEQIAGELGVSVRTIEQDNAFNAKPAPERFAVRVQNILRLQAAHDAAVDELIVAVAECARRLPTAEDIKAILGAVREVGWDPGCPQMRPLQKVLELRDQLEDDQARAARRNA